MGIQPNGPGTPIHNYVISLMLNKFVRASQTIKKNVKRERGQQVNKYKQNERVLCPWVGGVGVGVGTHCAPGAPPRRQGSSQGPMGPNPLSPPHRQNTLSICTFLFFVTPLHVLYFGGVVNLHISANTYILSCF